MVIPPSVFMWRTRLQMAPYIPSIRRCYKCGQLNHATKFCKNSAKCLLCGKDLHPEHQQCVTKPNCINCNGKHHTLAKECPETIIKKKATELMAFKNINYNLAKKKLVQGFYNKPETNKILPHLSQGTHFPSLDSPFIGRSFAAITKGSTNSNSCSSPPINPYHPGSESQEGNRNIIFKFLGLQAKDSNENKDKWIKIFKHLEKDAKWNCQSILRKKLELETRIQDFQIVALSETWLTKEDRFLIKNFDTIRKDHTGRVGGGIALLVKKPIQYQVLNNLNDLGGKLEVCGARIFFNNGQLNIISLYNPPASCISAYEWSSFFSQFQGDSVYLGDYNAHHPSWGNNYSCPVGR
nr:PREDICTED: uncharacterized protein LOC105668589 [Linepithema humile]